MAVNPEPRRAMPGAGRSSGPARGQVARYRDGAEVDTAFVLAVREQQEDG